MTTHSKDIINKATYLRTEYVKDKFKPYKIKYYSYRGKTYWLEFDLTGFYLGMHHSARGGHIYYQSQIDNQLDKTYVSVEDAEIGFNLFYDYCEEN